MNKDELKNTLLKYNISKHFFDTYGIGGYEAMCLVPKDYKF